MAASYRFIVKGRVQGVYFRQSAANNAERLGLAGWIRNREDGAVEGAVAGSDYSMESFRQWLYEGPPMARVETVDWDAADEEPGAGFSVRS